MNQAVDAYIERSKKWPNEMIELRELLLGCGLTEEMKWGKPCYCDKGRNIAILQEMNDFLALMFFRGALLDDPDGVLREQGPNSRSALRMEFTSVDEVARLSGPVRSLVAEAIAVEDAGLRVGPAPEPELVEELRGRLDGDPAFKAAFDALTPGRRREYNLHISGAKLDATRAARVDACLPKILAGKGFRD